MHKEFFLEIGTEELPSGFLNDIRKDLPGQVEKIFQSYSLASEGVRVYYTPRRITVYISRLDSIQKEEIKEVIGPPAKVGLDRKGKPTEAAIGFAKSNGVSLNALQIKKTPKGEYLCFKKEKERLTAVSLLPEILPGLIMTIRCPKSMKWDQSGIRFARPIRWLFAIFGSAHVNFRVGEVVSGDYTYGHRYYGSRKLRAGSFNEYKNLLAEKDVILDQDEREQLIIKQIFGVYEKTGLKNMSEPDLELVREAVNMTEYPQALYGTFSAEYLKLPREVLITSMKKHQGFFALVDNRGSLRPGFISIIDLKTNDTEIIKRGNEKVLRSRLEDAKFFFESDSRRTLESRIEDLAKVMFQQKLGTLYDKTSRLEKVAKIWSAPAELTQDECKNFIRAVRLSKTDLLTEMVGEFPSLQGTMGMIYGLGDGENPEVTRAIGEQYMPRFAGDDLPSSKLGALLSITDKLDSINGCFWTGLIPSGSQDPYALRRQALAVVQILVEKKLDVSLEDLIKKSLAVLSGAVEQDKEDIFSLVTAFFRSRLEYYLSAMEISYDVINSVVAVHGENPYRASLVAGAINEYYADDEFRQLLLSIKRTFNIIPYDKEFSVVSENLLEKEEIDLCNAAIEIKERVEPLFAKGDYKAVIKVLSTINRPISNFFDKVLVMCEDTALRENRLGLLQYIHKIFVRVADFSRIVTKP